MCTHIRLGRGWAVSGQACVRLLQTLTGDSVCNHLPGQASASYCGDNVLKEEQRRNCLQRWHDEKLCQSSKRLVKLSKMSQTPLCGFLHTLKINKSVAFPCRLTSRVYLLRTPIRARITLLTKCPDPPSKVPYDRDLFIF